MKRALAVAFCILFAGSIFRYSVDNDARRTSPGNDNVIY